MVKAMPRTPCNISMTVRKPDCLALGKSTWVISPVATAFESGADFVRPVRPSGIAKSLAIGNPADGAYALDEVRRSGGAVAAVTDDEIMDAYTFLAQQESVFCEAASSASVAGLIKQGVPEGSMVVCVLTGHGLKDPDLAIKAISVPSVIDLDLDTVLAEISL